VCVPRRLRRIVVCNVHSAWCVKDLWMGGLKIGRLSFIPLFPDCRFVSQTTGKILRKRVSVKDLREKGCQNMKGPSPCHMPYPPLLADVPAIPFAGVVAGVVATIVPVAHIIARIITHVVACRRPLSTPTVVAQVIAHRHRCRSPPPPSSMSRR
jgi:hypothetical protein